jgi:hypothetical protein
MQQATLEKHGWVKQGRAKNGVETYEHPEHGRLFVDHYSLKWRHGTVEGDTSYSTSPKSLSHYVSNLPKHSTKPLSKMQAQLDGTYRHSQHSESEQFGDPGKPVETKTHYGFPFNVKFHGGEHSGKVATIHSIIPKRYNKEEDTYRGKLHGDFKSQSARNIIVTGKHLSNFAHYHGGETQHSEEQPEKADSLNVSGAAAVFGPAVSFKQKVEPVTQHAENNLLAGRSNFLLPSRRGGPHPLFNKLLKKYGGIVHNAHGGFTLPKKAADSFNQAAHDAGFQHGYHYSLRG